MDHSLCHQGRSRSATVARFSSRPVHTALPGTHFAVYITHNIPPFPYDNTAGFHCQINGERSFIGTKNSFPHSAFLICNQREICPDARVGNFAPTLGSYLFLLRCPVCALPSVRRRCTQTAATRPSRCIRPGGAPIAPRPVSLLHQKTAQREIFRRIVRYQPTMYFVYFEAGYRASPAKKIRCPNKKDRPSGRSFFITITYRRGSDATAACGGNREQSEWPGSVCNAGAPSPRRTPGTPTGPSNNAFGIVHLNGTLVRASGQKKGPP